MRTNVDIDDRLLAEGLKLSGIRTKKELIHQALSDWVRRKRQRRLLKLEGKVLWEGKLSRLRGDQA